jgi:uncharacterized SAM-binding protein YcdF (DUF218 family)
MFFIASKVLWFLLAPVNLLLVIALLAIAAGRRAPAILCIVALLAIGATPIGARLIEPLENRFPPQPEDMAAPYGIIILGGAIDDELGRARGRVSIGDGAERLTQAVTLSRRFPEASIVYTGGNNSLRGAETSEAADALKLLTALGVDRQRITIEAKSRNTDENARFTRDLLHPAADQRWLLITSAWHMPRSMGLFRKAGFDVVAYPVDYRTTGGIGDWRFNAGPLRGLSIFDLATHEWTGLFFYWLTGRTDVLFPAP